MIAAIRALLASRKFVLLLVGTIVAIGGRFGLALDTEIVGMIVGLFAIAIGGIAYEDGQAKNRPAAVSTPVVVNSSTLDTAAERATAQRFGELLAAPAVTTTTTTTVAKDPAP